MSATKRIHIIGSGFAGLSSAAYLAQMGHEVTVFEKNDQIGGRARSFQTDGFTFDMGPSWYWMPEVFEQFYQDFGHTTSDFYQLDQLDPSYRVYFGKDDFIDVPAGEEAVIEMFEDLDPGSGSKLHSFLREAEYKYKVGMADFVEKPSHSVFEFFDWRILQSALKLDMFGNVSKSVEKITKNDRLRQILEFPVLFLGAKPSKTPALYSMMNYADITLGTWYPQGGMHEIVKAMASVAREQGVQFKTGSPVEDLKFSGADMQGLISQENEHQADGFVAACDYHHFEQKLLPQEKRKYDQKYWDKRVLAPSCILFYLGVDKKLDGLEHHNLFFDTDFDQHAREIYDDPSWPKEPLFYVCAPSKTDKSVAPEGNENIFILIPVATGQETTPEIIERYYDIVMERLENLTGQSVKEHIIYKRSFAHQDFVKDYNSFRGNAYGLANTLLQTAFLKPKMRNRKINNLVYSGQLTTPGPGVPPSIISGRVAARELHKMLR